MPDISERNFEETIERTLLQFGPDAYAGDPTAVSETADPFGEFVPGGYRKRSHTDYDRDLCLIPRDVLDFILACLPCELQEKSRTGLSKMERRE